MSISDKDDDESEYTERADVSGPSAIWSLIEEALFVEERLLFDLKSRSLKPLCKIEATEEAVTVTFDLPYVEKDDISLTSTEDTLSVEAKMRKAITLKVGGSIQRHVEFERYTKHIKLSRRVEPEKATATFKNGLLRVKFPLAKKGNRVRIR
jgi:HSP20 family protein